MRVLTLHKQKQKQIEMKTDYQKFLESKKHLLGSFGFEPNFIPNMAFDFQRELSKELP